MANKVGGLPYTIDIVREKVNNAGYKLLSNDYINRDSLITYQCPEGHKSTTSFHSFQNKIRNNLKCKQCHIESLKHDLDMVKFKAKELGHTLISTKYVNARTKLKFICGSGHEFKTTWDHYNNRNFKGNGCKKCGHLANSLEGAYNYKGYRPVKSWIRNRLQDWKRESLEAHDYTCYVTGARGQSLEVHHTRNFSEIFYKAIKKLKLPDRLTIGDYTRNELILLEQTIHGMHTQTGIPLKKSVHKQFHEKYGKRGNTLKQLLEFKANYEIKHKRKNNG
jgi:hypothetical protein